MRSNRATFAASPEEAGLPFSVRATETTTAKAKAMVLSMNRSLRVRPRLINIMVITSLACTDGREEAMGTALATADMKMNLLPCRADLQVVARTAAAAITSTNLSLQVVQVEVGRNLLRFLPLLCLLETDTPGGCRIGFRSRGSTNSGSSGSRICRSRLGMVGEINRRSSDSNTGSTRMQDGSGSSRTNDMTLPSICVWMV